MSEFYRNKFIKLRKLKGLTIEKVIKQAGITRVTLWRWENGKNEPSEMQIRALSRILDISVSEISDLIDEKPLSKAHFSDIINSWLVLADSTQQQLINQENKMIDFIRQRHYELMQTSTVIRALLNSMDSIFYIKDINLNYITVNNMFLQNLHLNKNYSVFGKNDGDLFSSIESKKNNEQDQEVLLTGKAVKEYEDYIPGSRKKKWGLISKSPIFDSEQKIAGIVGTFVDITDRKKNENRRKLLESAIDKIEEYCIWVTKNESDNRMKSNYIYMNNSVETIFGIEKEKACKNASLLLENVHPDSKEDVRNFLATKGFSDRVIYKYLHPVTSELRWLYTVVYKYKEELFGITRDITEVKKALNEKLLLNTLLTAAEDIVGFYNLEDNKMLYINDMIEKVSGYPKEDFYNDISLWDKIVYPDDREEFAKLALCEEWVERISFRIVSKNGEIRKLSSTAHSHKEIDNRNYHVWILRDITDMEERIEKHKILPNDYINKFDIAKKMQQKGIDSKIIFEISGVCIKACKCGCPSCDEDRSEHKIHVG